MRIRPRNSRAEGVAVLVVLVLIVIMASYIVVNTRVLAHLDRELRHLEEKQKKRLGPVPAAPKPGPNLPAKGG